MPSAVAPGHPPARHDDLDNYNVADLSDDPFASPSPPSSAKKRKQPDSGLGIDEEVSVQKRVRVPAVKLDEERLLGPAGIPRLRERARDLRIKGKGHEFSDASRLLSFYQLWLDDLFPKAKFRDALAMVEKAGHKRRVVAARHEWMNEGKPKPREDEDEELLLLLRNDEEPTGNTAQASEQPARPQTPVRSGDIPDDDDLYDATPRAAVPTRAAVPDGEDDLDALIAEAEGNDGSSRPQPQPQASNAEPDGDDLEAFIAEAEARKQPSNAGGQGNTEFDDEEAAMQEMEMEGLW
ncbi:Chromosome segregation in meiosis protein 3 [Tolypocladium ophioglossoides CBS 100239]|uniref:Chromosome segregation in meiosis protein n=1 Tax=Tolypocladium ophioglossoides (strain CBS 100239) TaxID=1163406 RepID=A0A0L0NG43_TOLOC|nr:Chromosome segregation in meiosis protein 3 [Tolypocladium ophioglossoides CBS 100239]